MARHMRQLIRYHSRTKDVARPIGRQSAVHARVTYRLNSSAPRRTPSMAEDRRCHRGEARRLARLVVGVAVVNRAFSRASRDWCRDHRAFVGRRAQQRTCTSVGLAKEVTIGPQDGAPMLRAFEDGVLLVVAGNVEDLLGAGIDDREAVLAP